MGNAGSRLNAARLTLIQSLWLRKPPPPCPTALYGAGPEPSASTARRMAANTTFTAGPARATSSSCFGWSGIRSSLDTPPIRHDHLMCHLFLRLVGRQLGHLAQSRDRLAARSPLGLGSTLQGHAAS